VVVVSISPSNVNRSKLTQEEEKCLQLNAQASYVLIRALSEDVLDAIMDEDDDYHTNHDAHCIWITLKDMYGACEYHSQNGMKLEVPVLETGCSSSISEVTVDCSLSKDDSCHRPHEESTCPNHSCSHHVQVKRQEDYLIERLKELKSLKEEMRKLNESNVSLFDKFLIESCDDLITQENENLKQEVEKLKMDLSRLKDRSIAQPSQNNRDSMVKKFEKGSTLQCSYNNSIKSIAKLK
uniref:Uncharacterized protein n=1 Tax=Setaria italica TaxID=4555 RepID=K3ZDE1_SETIT